MAIIVNRTAVPQIDRNDKGVSVHLSLRGQPDSEWTEVFTELALSHAHRYSCDTPPAGVTGGPTVSVQIDFLNEPVDVAHQLDSLRDFVNEVDAEVNGRSAFVVSVKTQAEAWQKNQPSP